MTDPPSALLCIRRSGKGETPVTTLITGLRFAPRTTHATLTAVMVTPSPEENASVRPLTRNVGDSAELSPRALARAHTGVTLTSGRRTLVARRVMPPVVSFGVRSSQRSPTSVSMLRTASRVVSPEPLSFSSCIPREMHVACVILLILF